MKPSPLSRTDALCCIPIRNPLVLENRLDSGEILLSYPETLRPWFAGILRRMKKESELRRMRKLQLDILGTGVWDLVDNKSTVMEIIDSFAGLHQLYRKESEVSVIQFLRELGRRGIIGMKQINESVDSFQISAGRSTAQ
ncbi:MAG: PqqD family peptide modification chaperone [Deltaproteobacteria bacterium]|nr:PqqD family peptide modification chaperone [Deltaproteobacteria bacterium]